MTNYCVMYSREVNDVIEPRFAFFDAKDKHEAKLMGDLVDFYSNSVVLFTMN